MAGYRGDLLVHSCLTDDSIGQRFQRATKDQRTQLQWIDPEVEQPTTTQVGTKQSIFKTDWAAEAEVGFDQKRISYATTAELIDQNSVRRKEATPDRLHQEETPLPGLFHHLLHLPRVECEWVC